MNKYSYRDQRIGFYKTLHNDGILKSQFTHYKGFDQLGAIGKVPIHLWKNVFFRFIFNLCLPYIVILSNIYYLFKYSILKFFHRYNNIQFKRLFLCEERHLYLLAKRINLVTEKDVWFSSPFDTFSLPYKGEKISISDYVTFNDIFRSFLQTLIIQFYSIFHFGYNYLLLSLKSFNWCLMDLALRKIPEDTELYYCNICDRVAIMVDRLPHKNKIMLQHGTMHFFNNPDNIKNMTWQEDKGFWIWNSLYKNSPNKVLCFTKDDEIALKRSVIANEPEFVHIGYDFHPMYKPNKYSVLIIGMYTLFESQEAMIIEYLQNLDIDIYLKNHPSIANEKYNELRTKYNFIFIDGNESKLPDVDLVISYDSTLALEYASIGTKVLYYSHFQTSEIRSLVENHMQNSNNQLNSRHYNK